MQPSRQLANHRARPPKIAREHAALLGMARRLTALDSLILAVVAVQVALHIVAALLAAGWVTAAAADGVMLVVLGSVALCYRPARPLVWRLMLFGLVAGGCELFTDYAGENVIQSLSYPSNEPLILASPAYMPFSWMIVLTPLGYLAWRLTYLTRRRWATPIAGIIGALLIPFYEEMAYRAGWWHYTPTRWHLAHTPAYVLLFEGLVIAALPLLLRRLEQRDLRSIVVRGIILGLWMPCAALLAWLALAS